MSLKRSHPCLNHSHVMMSQKDQHRIQLCFPSERRGPGLCEQTLTKEQVLTAAIPWAELGLPSLIFGFFLLTFSLSIPPFSKSSYSNSPDLRNQFFASRRGEDIPKTENIQAAHRKHEAQVWNIDPEAHTLEQEPGPPNLEIDFWILSPGTQTWNTDPGTQTLGAVVLAADNLVQMIKVKV